MYGFLRHHTHYNEHTTWAHRQTTPDNQEA
jgi:hypothetical protein